MEDKVDLDSSKCLWNGTERSCTRLQNLATCAMDSKTFRSDQYSLGYGSERTCRASLEWQFIKYSTYS